MCGSQDAYVAMSVLSSNAWDSKVRGVAMLFIPRWHFGRRRGRIPRWRPRGTLIPQHRAAFTHDLVIALSDGST
jgi:hypothetical protein